MTNSPRSVPRSSDRFIFPPEILDRIRVLTFPITYHRKRRSPVPYGHARTVRYTMVVMDPSRFGHPLKRLTLQSWAKPQERRRIVLANRSLARAVGFCVRNWNRPVSFPRMLRFSMPSRVVLRWLKSDERSMDWSRITRTERRLGVRWTPVGVTCSISYSPSDHGTYCYVAVQLYVGLDLT